MNWYKRCNKIDKEDMLFHGTVEPIKGEIGPYSHGGILWMAETPDIAQNYIPSSGGSVLVSLPDWDHGFPPNKGFNIRILKQMGYPEMDIVWNHIGRAESWGWKDKSINQGFPTYQDVRQYVMDVLGYQSKYDSDGFEIKTGENGALMPADFKEQGTLFIGVGKSNLKILDLTDDPGDLTDPTYNKFHLFEEAKSQGYDGVRINDYAQSENYGNWGHVSIGLFDSGVKKLQMHNVPATHFDWGENIEDSDTPEFKEWYGELS